MPTLNRAWRRRLNWYPGDWIWPSLLALVIAAAAGIGSATYVEHEKSSPAYVDRTSPVGSAPAPEAPPEQTTSTPRGAPPQQRPRRPRRVPPARTQALTVWPAGKQGWTVVLQSLPQANGRAFALAQARAAQQSGLAQVGILDSSKYSSLHPGYYVLFSGIHSSLEDAQTAATTAHSRGYPRAYARPVTP